jgi:hypothetical protein
MGFKGLLSRRCGNALGQKVGKMWMRSDGDAWEYGEEGDAGKEDSLRNMIKDITWCNSGDNATVKLTQI